MKYFVSDLRRNSPYAATNSIEILNLMYTTFSNVLLKLNCCAILVKQKYKIMYYN